MLTPVDASWRLSLRAAGLGCAGAMAALPAAEPEAKGNRARYARAGIEERPIEIPGSSGLPAEFTEIKRIQIKADSGRRVPLSSTTPWASAAGGERNARALWSIKPCRPWKNVT